MVVDWIDNIKVDGMDDVMLLIIILDVSGKLVSNFLVVKFDILFGLGEFFIGILILFEKESDICIFDGKVVIEFWLYYVGEIVICVILLGLELVEVKI